jgi:hypothetical protein
VASLLWAKERGRPPGHREDARSTSLERSGNTSVPARFWRLMVGEFLRVTSRRGARKRCDENCNIQQPLPPFRSTKGDRAGHWQAVCQCGVENYYEPDSGRVRLTRSMRRPAQPSSSNSK